MTNLKDLECEMCSGFGFTAEHDINCDCNENDGGYRCPVQVQCDVCNGSGYSKDKVMSLFLSNPEEFLAGLRIIEAMKESYATVRISNNEVRFDTEKKEFQGYNDSAWVGDTFISTTSPLEAIQALLTEVQS